MHQHVSVQQSKVHRPNQGLGPKITRPVCFGSTRSVAKETHWTWSDGVCTEPYGSTMCERTPDKCTPCSISRRVMKLAQMNYIVSRPSTFVKYAHRGVTKAQKFASSKRLSKACHIVAYHNLVRALISILHPMLFPVKALSRLSHT